MAEEEITPTPKGRGSDRSVGEELNIEELKKQRGECEKKAAEYLAGWQRERADFLNYKKDEIERIGELLKYAGEGIISKILPILDNFEIAERNLSDKDDKNAKGFLQIKAQFRDFLKGYGVEEIKSMGEKFDPNFHEVVEEVADNGSPQVIVEEIHK